MVLEYGCPAFKANIGPDHYTPFKNSDIPYMSQSSTSISSGTWPFNQAQFLIMNVAVGGDWPGSPTAQTVFPQSMYVDYVRVFQ